jgi:hypothetical protein
MTHFVSYALPAPFPPADEAFGNVVGNVGYVGGASGEADGFEVLEDEDEGD